jgi:hypothetical protein
VSSLDVAALVVADCVGGRPDVGHEPAELLEDAVDRLAVDAG